MEQRRFGFLFDV